jgi:hypothetical protein
MVRFNHIVSAAALTAAFTVSSASAAFSVFENFNGLTNGNLNGQNGWSVASADAGDGASVTTDPNNASNKYMTLFSDGSGAAPFAGGLGWAYKPGLNITGTGSDAKATVFARVFLPTNGNSQDFIGQGADYVSTDGFNNFATLLRGQGTTNTNYTLSVHTGSGFSNVATPANNQPIPSAALTGGVKLSLWYFIDKTNNTWQLYMQDATSAAAPVQVVSAVPSSTWNYRDSATAVNANASPIDLFLAAIGRQSYQIDDIYFEKGDATYTVNTALPPGVIVLPEPATIGLLGGVAVLALRRRK